MGSKKFSLDMTDVVSLLKTAFLVAAAAFITAVMNGLGSLDLGVYTAMIIPVVTVFLDTVLRWLKNNQKEDNPVNNNEKE